MNKYAVLKLKTDLELTAHAIIVANKLGISLSTVLNNELRRFASEQSVVFYVPEKRNANTAAQLAASKQQIEAGELYQFTDNKQAMVFLANEYSK